MRAHHLEVRRTARYYTLGDADDDAGAPTGTVDELWVVCHGYGQLAAAFLESFVPVAAPTRLIVAPEALSRFYVDPRSIGGLPRRVGAAWMTREDREHEISDQVAYLDAMFARVDRGAPNGRARLRVLGFSQGVATVARWLAYGSVRADQVILWAGAVPPEIDRAALADRFATTSVVLVSGTRDALASWADAEAETRRFIDAGIRARLVTFDGGHSLDTATLTAIAASG